MAVRSGHAPHKAESEAEVASCVANLIQAFTNGLNIFKRLREKRKKRRAHKESQTAATATSAELQLSKSLRKGPDELAVRYAECYHSGMGPQFAKGDGKQVDRKATVKYSDTNYVPQPLLMPHWPRP